jgi:competence protein ComEA
MAVAGEGGRVFFKSIQPPARETIRMDAVRALQPTRFLTAILLALALVLFAGMVRAAPVDVNTASAEELAESLTGVGEKIAAEIVRHREENGPFESVDDLLEVKGIGEKLLEKNQDLILLEPAG